MRVECKTQQECDAALLAGNIPVLIGDGYFTIKGNAYVEACGSSSVVAWESSRVEAWESSRVVARESSSVVARESSRVEAWESSSVEARGSSRVEAWGSSSVEARGSSSVVACGSSSVEARGSSRVEAWGSSSVVARESSSVEARESSRVEAWESSRVEAWESSRVEAWGSSRVEAWGSSRVVARESSSVVARESSRVEASKFVAVQIHSDNTKINGGVQIMVIAPSTPVEWCEYYGAKIEDDCAILYKAVDENFLSPHGFLYAPGTTPACNDWDGIKRECGGGLHFSPSPSGAKNYNPSAKKFVACPVELTQIVVHQNAQYPDKVKAPRVAKPIYEVDMWGGRVKDSK
jgi:hypothetical protein